MAAIDYYVSIPWREPIPDEQTDSGLNNGTAPANAGADYIELRMRVQDGSSNPTGLTRKDVIHALEDFERYIIQGGQLGTGINLPVS
jgi:hypothetical protein